MRGLSQHLGLQLPRPGSLVLGQHQCTVWERGKTVPGSVGTSRRLANASRGEPGMGAGDPFLLILSPGISGFGTGRLSLGWGRRLG